MTTYTIRFDYPEGTVYAGMYKGAFGWAPTLATALMWDDADKALAAVGAYGPSSARWAKVVPVTAH